MKYKNKEPQHGDLRVTEHFALLPARLDAETKVWLETYWEVERYSDVVQNGYYGVWLFVSRHSSGADARAVGK